MLAMVAPLDAAAWGVLAGGVVLIALVLWYFFGEREAVRAEPVADGVHAGGVQRVEVPVGGATRAVRRTERRLARPSPRAPLPPFEEQP